MKINTFLGQVAVFLAFAFLFAACSSDNSNEKPTLEGKWYYSEITVDGVSDAVTDDGCGRDFIEITASQLQTTLYNFDVDLGCQTTSSISAYQRSGMLISLASSEPFFEIITLSDDTLVLQLLQPMDVDGDSQTDNVVYTFLRD